MTPERWQQLQELFNAAVELTPSQQAAFLDQACADDATLRQQAESLLLASADATKRIQSAIGDAARDLPRLEDTLLIGPYKVIQELGRGGMGAVYLAVRADDEYQKRVAIKVVQHDLADPEVLRRFRNERQILAGLDHPYIARLLDGGTTPAGMPYVVMEYVEGDPIDRYCNQHRLSINERLKLFRDVCAAVHYAHQNLIIHRDLKPGNILVTAGGVPKLLDFGIAKLLNPELGPQTQAITRWSMRLMTPEYASPEQIRGEPITTASDVYSLGVVLYELLTGHRPYRFKKYQAQEIERIVSFEEPAKPSTVVGRPRLLEPDQADSTRNTRLSARNPEKLRRQLAGELDAIVMMALRKESQRRYASTEQMSEDIRRYLKGRPVRARPDTMRYRTSKFIKRHKVGAATAALLFLTLLGGVTATTWQARIARSERARAEGRFNDVRKLANSFIFDVHDNIADLPGSTRAREGLVKTSLEYLNSLAQEAGNDPSLQRELALAYQRVGDVQGNPTNANLGDTAGALASYRKALTIGEALVAANPSDAEAQRSVALTYQKLSDLQGWTGDLNGAVESARKAVAFFTTLADADTTNLKALQSRAVSHIKLGDILGNPLFPNTGNRVEGLNEYHQSLALWQSLHASDSTDFTTRRYLGLVHERIGTMQQQQGNFAEALVSYQQSLIFRESLAADHPTNTDARRDLGVGYEKMAEILASTGDATRALEYSHKSLLIFEGLSVADPKNVNASRSLSISYENVGDIFLRTGDASGSLENYLKSHAILERLQTAGASNVQFGRDLARLYSKLGGASAALAATPETPTTRRIDRWRQAIEWQEKSLNLWLNLRNRNVLRGDDVQQADRITEELHKSKLALAKIRSN